MTGGDDYAALTQALGRWGRRLTGAEAGVPEVLMIDGGRGQLGAAAAAVDELRSGGMRLVAVDTSATAVPSPVTVKSAPSRDANRH